MTDCDEVDIQQTSSKTAGEITTRNVHRVIAHDESFSDEFNNYQGMHDDNTSNRDDSFSKSSKFNYSKDERKISNKQRKQMMHND